MARTTILFSLLTLASLSPQEPGHASVESTEVGSSSNWQNWIFAGSALVSATLGVVIVSLSTGTQSH